MKPIVVLLAEDDTDLRYFVRVLLRANGFTVLAACNGTEALETSRNFPGAIDLLLSDVDMPGVDGFQLSLIVAKERPGVRSLLMSGSCRAERMAQISGLLFIQKPFTVITLRHALETLLGSTVPFS
jgi:CheY-like chemotaxis protein